MYPLSEVIYKIKDPLPTDSIPEKRLKVKDNKITIYSKTVQFNEIINNVVFDIKNVRR